MQESSRAQRQSNRGNAANLDLTDTLEVESQASSGNAEAITGSGSLLSSSELDGFNPRHGSWKSVDDTSPVLSRVHTNNSSTSPLRRQNSNLLVPQPFNDTNASSFSYSAMNPGSATISSRSSQKNFLDPTSGNFATGAFDASNTNRTSRHNSDEENRFAARKMAFEGLDTGVSMQSSRPSFTNNASGYTSSAASQSGSMPPSRNEIELSGRYKNDNTSAQLSRFNQPPSQRQNLSARAPPYVVAGSGQKYGGQLSPSQMNQLYADFTNMDVGRENQRHANPTQSEASYGSMSSLSGGYNHDFVPNSTQPWSRDEDEYLGHQDHIPSVGNNAASLTSHPSTRRGITVGPSYSQSPSIGDTRLSHNSPYYSTGGTPPSYQQRMPSRGGFSSTVTTGEAALLDRKLRNIQQEQQPYVLSRANQMSYGRQYPQPNSYDSHPQHSLPMNQLPAYYPMPQMPHHIANSQIPRGPARDHEIAQAARSPLLEEFRNNSKTNKRYELKVCSSSV